MKITIAPTDSKSGESEVSVAVKHDDLTVGAAANLVRKALLGWGYAEKSVNDEINAFNEDAA